MELSVLREAHFRRLENEGKSKETIRFYLQSYKELEDYLGADAPAYLDLNLLTREDMYSVMGRMKDRGCEVGSVHAIMRGMRAIMNWATEEEYLSKNPMSKVKLPSIPRKVQPAVQPDTVQRVLRLTEHDGAYKLRNAAIVSVMFDTGLRLGEVAGLDLAHIDLEQATLFVEAGKGMNQRVVPFGNSTVKRLNAYIRTRKPKFRGETRLWLGKGGEPLTKWGIILMLEKYAVALEMERKELAPHAWRRGFAVEYLRNEGDLFMLQQLMGHNSLEMTRKYVHYLPADIKRVHKMISPVDRLGK